MQIATEQQGRATVVRIDGAIAMQEILDLRDVMKSTIADGNIQIAVDLSRVPHIDSSGIGLLLSWSLALRKAGGRFRMFNAPEVVKKWAIGDRMSIHPTEAEALKDMI